MDINEKRKQKFGKFKNLTYGDIEDISNRYGIEIIWDKTLKNKKGKIYGKTRKSLTKKELIQALENCEEVLYNIRKEKDKLIEILCNINKITLPYNN